MNILFKSSLSHPPSGGLSNSYLSSLQKTGSLAFESAPIPKRGTIYISYQGRAVSTTHLYANFTRFGEVKKLIFGKSKQKRNKLERFFYAFVTFKRVEDARKVLEMGSLDYRGVYYEIRPVKPKQRQKKR